MAAEEVEQLVTFPIETAVNGATGVRRVRSSSTTGFSVVWGRVRLGYGHISRPSDRVGEAGDAGRDAARECGQPDARPPVVNPRRAADRGPSRPTAPRCSICVRWPDWTIRPRLLSTGGVAQVAVLGGDIKEYQVLLHPERMKHYGVTLADVMAVHARHEPQYERRRDIRIRQ